MTLVMFTNHSPHALHLGGKLIRPGETREVAAVLLPPEVVAVDMPEVSVPPNVLEALRAERVKTIIETLPDLTDAELVTLRDLEIASAQPRSTLLEGIAAEQLRRVAAED